MKTLANPRDREEIVTRLAAIDRGSQRRWGRMTAHQMICHVTDAFRMSVGELQVSRATRMLPRPILRFAALWVHTPWPHGFPARPELDQQRGGTSPEVFERDLAKLHCIIERFAAQPPTFIWPEHPDFGRMNRTTWMRCGYLHMDHHLRQFGA